VEALTLGALRAEPGTKVTGFLEVPGTAIQMPVTLAQGTVPGPLLSISAGVHGGEYPGIEAAIQTAASLDPQQVRGSVVIVHIVDVPAFHGRNIYICPLDGKNPNRVFPGNPKGTVSERLAHALFSEVIARAQFYVDLHGGDINEGLVPFTIIMDSGDREVDDRALTLARVYGIRYVIRGRVAGGSYAAAAQRGIPAILPEAGGQGLLDQQALQIHLRAHVTRLKTVRGDLRPRPRRPCPGHPGVHLERDGSRDRAGLAPWVRSAGGSTALVSSAPPPAPSSSPW